METRDEEGPGDAAQNSAEVAPTPTPDDAEDRPASGSRARRAALTALVAVPAAAVAFLAVYVGLAGGFPGNSGAAANEGTDPASGPGAEEAPPGQRAPAAWDVDWSATYQRPSDAASAYSVTPLSSFDDGLNASSLPPLAPRPSPRFPVAYEVTDAIWDAVGPGWGVAVYSARSYEYADSAGLTGLPASFYLVSPEGLHFHLWDLTEEETYGVALSAWIDDVDLELGWIAVGHSLASMESESATYDVRDLRSGALLTSYDYGEGYYVGTDRIFLGAASDGRSAWADVVYSGGDGGGDSTVTVFAGSAAGAEVAVSIVPPAGTPLDGVSQLGPDSDAVLFQFSDFLGGNSYFVVDLATATATEVHPRLPGDTTNRCLSFTNVTPDSAIADCEDGGATFGRYLLDLTGSSDPVRLGAGEDPYNGDWSLPGWELVPTPGDVGRQGLDDVSGGARTSVVLPAPHATAWGLTTPARPQQFAPNLYVFAETEQGLILGYDRNARKVFAICPEFWEDTQVVSALSGYALLYDTIGG